MKRRWRNYLLADTAALAGVAAIAAVIAHRPGPLFPLTSEETPTAQIRCTTLPNCTLAQILRQKHPLSLGTVEGNGNTLWKVNALPGKTPDEIVCELRDERNRLLRRVTLHAGSLSAGSVARLTLQEAREQAPNTARFSLQTLGPGIELSLVLSAPRKKASSPLTAISEKFPFLSFGTGRR